MNIEKAVYYLRYLAEKADVKHDMRVSISFASDGDKYRFMREITREMMTADLKPDPAHTDELMICGIRVRIL